MFIYFILFIYLIRYLQSFKRIVYRLNYIDFSNRTELASGIVEEMQVSLKEKQKQDMKKK